MSVTPEQRRAIESEAPRICVRAGAGSGKTRVLIERMMHLIEHREIPLERIVAITFTEKAALEMKNRLRDACRKRAPDDDPDKLTFWRNVERSVSSARISTIHAFCAGLLREHALHLGTDPDFAMLEDADTHLLRDNAVRQELLRLLQAGDEDAMRVAAELGFEKTYEQMRAFLKGGAESSRAIVRMRDGSVESVRNAWCEMEEYAKAHAPEYLRADPRLLILESRLEALEGACSDPGDVREVLRRTLIEAIDGAEAITDYSQIETLVQRLSAKAKPANKDVWTSEHAAREVLKVKTSLRELLDDYRWNGSDTDDEEAARELTGAFLRTFARVVTAYDDAKQSMTAHDFDDLIVRAHRILQSNAQVRTEVARSMSHLLIDEFQDTDGMQYEIAECLHGARNKPNLFVVGDAKQSIYLFRGAEVEIFDQAEKAAQETVHLDDNFRSVPGVLRFVNAFFSENKSLAIVEAPYGDLRPNRAADEKTRIEFLVPDPPEDKPNIETLRRAEAEMLATRLRELVDAKISVGDREGAEETQRPVRYGDMAILFRTLGDVHIYEQSLRRYGIPFTVVSGAGFYERQEIRDLRNFLSLVADPFDEMALLAYLRSPLAGLSDVTIMQAAGVLSEGGISLTRFFGSDAAVADPVQQDRLTRARRLLANARAHREWSAPKLLRFVLDESGYEAMLLRQDFLGDQRAGNVRKLVALAESFSHSRSPGLVQFLHYLEDVAKTELREGEAPEVSHNRNAVTLMTIHQSKGLEFPVVVLADTARGNAPRPAGTVARHRNMGIAVRAEDDDGNDLRPSAWSCIDCMRKWQERAESARLLYVALTRACDHLLIGGALQGGENWMREFDNWLELARRNDGEAFSGDGWHGVVWRRPRTVTASKEVDQSQLQIASEQLKRQIGPVLVKGSISEVSVTALAARLSSGETNIAPANGATTSPNAFALTRGTAAHKLMQLWNFAADRTPEIPSLIAGTPLDASARAQLTRDLETIATNFRQSELFDTLRSEPDTDRELDLRWRVDATYINGVIDARYGNVLIDYKTGGQSDALKIQYEWQLRLYAAALRAITRETPEKALLCYLDIDGAPCTEVVFTDSLIDETEARMHEALAEIAAESN